MIIICYLVGINIGDSGELKSGCIKIVHGPKIFCPLRQKAAGLALSLEWEEWSFYSNRAT